MKTLLKRVQKIKCPVCGYEYLPCEIFIPQYLFTKPSLIERDEEGKIEYVFGEKGCIREEYQCDKCDKTFSVRCSMQFFPTVDNVIDWGEEDV